MSLKIEPRWLPPSVLSRPLCWDNRVQSLVLALQAQANNDLLGTMRAIRELRAYLELQHKLETEERKNVQAQALQSRGPFDDPGSVRIQEIRAKLLGEDEGVRTDPHRVGFTPNGEEH